MLKTIIPFSHLCLGGKFRYKDFNQVFVKISNNRKDGCIANWNPDLIDKKWIGQQICSLDENDEDIDIEVVY